MYRDNFNKCENCNKKDICLRECIFDRELLDSSYVNYYAEQIGLNDNYHREGIMIEISMFGKYE
ncbi:hypothetical protein [Romboutsia sp. 1001713B170207_170306_H8]|uniref:hypothetical protein n=1 Tax=Romboutsia sp. 1001713B170207_170306_H8 TaxID=2787112 RepID=UPI001898F0A1|nr:hypothetical protein [Romboutsia sp. 1001713B170207_170306_H8]